MKVILIALIAFLVIGCQTERTVESHETVTTETTSTEIGGDPQATSTDVSETRSDFDRTADDLREGASDAAAATETALREAARQTGTALERAGERLQEKAKSDKQPPQP